MRSAQKPPVVSGPHHAIATTDDRERFTLELFDRLWDRFRTRVSHVATYESVIRAAGATFVNDHIAFRTLTGQQPSVGIHTLSRIFDALGYRPAGCYHFEDKHLTAIHYQHPNRNFPKLFISELKSWELSEKAQQIISRTLADHRDPLSDDTLSMLTAIPHLDQTRREALLQTLVDHFQERPWNRPEKHDLNALNFESQYAAWVLVHGYNVNHFTSLVNSHGAAGLDDIEKTVAALRTAGVPMKSEIEGAAGSKLRQTATEAVVIDVDVLEHGAPVHMPWTYAYFEIAERGNVIDPETQVPTRFEGFLGPQATQLFDMTRLRD